MEALHAEAADHGRSLQQQVLAVLDEHTSRARLHSLLNGLDAALGNEPVLTTDPALAVRRDRDALAARDDERAGDYS